MNKTETYTRIEEKYREMGENPETYLKGLLHARPLTYWDYIEVDTLLSLQKPRTDFKDEEIFIMYHQVTELILKMMVHELKQLSEEAFVEETWITKLTRLNRYTSMLITSFDVMKYGMSYEDYNTFRSTLAPASGFQSVQFRHIELYCTRVKNLVPARYRSKLPEQPETADYFKYLYWKDAGYNRETGKKTLTLTQFETKYEAGLLELATQLKGRTLEERIENASPCSDALLAKLKEFDHLYNVAWPIVHLETAQHYLDARGENQAATGGSEWKKYLHPSYQQRRFFPGVWTEGEITLWGRQETTEL